MPALWRFLETGPGEAAWNMAVDEALAQEVREGRSRPVLRFYTWVHPAISCGYFQDIERELDQEACRERGVEVVRRPTGGRAVYHWSDLTISLAALENKTGIGNDIGETYHRIAQAVAWGLRAKGIPVELVRSQASGKEFLSSASCFASKSRHELVLGGRKIFGCAQRRWDGIVLSQGSLQLWGDGEVPPELRRPGLQPSALRNTCRKEATPREDMEKVKAGIAEGFRRTFGVELFPDGLSEEERGAAEKFLRTHHPPRREEDNLTEREDGQSFSCIRP
jgi:lipoate-protein ligase A